MNTCLSISPLVLSRTAGLLCATFIAWATVMTPRAIVITSPDNPGNFVNGGATFGAGGNSWYIAESLSPDGTLTFNFPDATRPAQAARSFNASFVVAGFLGSYDVSFGYSPGPVYFNGGLNVTYGIRGDSLGVMSVRWRGQVL